MTRRNEEPEWDTDSDDGSSQGDDSSYDGSEASSDIEDDGSNFNDEDGNDGGSQSDGSGDGFDSDSGSGSDSSDVSEDSSHELNDPFEDEEKGMGKTMSSGSLLNEPGSSNNNGDKPKWMMCVPGCIVAMGVWVAATFLCCLCLIPLLVIVIPLAVVLGGNDDTKVDVSKATTSVPAVTTAPVTGITIPPTSAPTTSPTAQATEAETTPPPPPPLADSMLTTSAATTIYRSGAQAETANSDLETLLVQTGPAGDSEFPTAYALVEFDGLLGIDSGATSVEAYLNRIESLEVEFCLQIASAESDERLKYKTCFVEVPEEDIETLTGQTATYTMPDDCIGGETIPFEFAAGDANVCANIAPLLLAILDDDNNNNNNSTDASADTDTDASADTDTDSETTGAPMALRGRSRRGLSPVNFEGNEGNRANHLLMIENPTPTDEPGTQFYSVADPMGRGPTLRFGGANTCRTFRNSVCTNYELTSFCELIKFFEASDVGFGSDFTTVFAPNNRAFEKAMISRDNFDTLTQDELLYHVSREGAPGQPDDCFRSATMANNGTTLTLCGKNNRIYQVGTGSGLGSDPKFPKIVYPMEMCGGVIQIIDDFLVDAGIDMDFNATDGGDETASGGACAEDGAKSIVDAICASPDHTTICAVLQASVFGKLFNSTALYTMFAPTDAAIANVADVDPNDLLMITDLLLQHVVYGSKILSDGLECDTEFTAANGLKNKVHCTEGDAGPKSIIGVGSDLTQNPPAVVETADIDACNGAIHSISGIIKPGPTPDYEIGEDYEDYEDGDGDGDGDGSSMLDVLYDNPDQYSDLLGFFENTNLFELIEGSATLFAPTNAAFESVKTSFPDVYANLVDANYEAPGWIAHVEDLLDGHVLDKELPSYAITDGLAVEIDSLGSELIFAREGTDIFIEPDVQLIQTDVPVGNGVLHVIDKVLIPYWTTINLADLAAGFVELSTLVTIANQTNVVETLKSPGPYTVFAPSNGAFQKYMDVDTASLDITAILNNHILEGLYPSAAIEDGASFTTLAGEEVVFTKIEETSTIKINDVRVTYGDRPAINGILHVIDGLLLPPAIAAQLEQGMPDMSEPTDSTEQEEEPAVDEEEEPAAEDEEQPAAEDEEQLAAEDEEQPAAEDEEQPAADEEEQPAAEDEEQPAAEDGAMTQSCSICSGEMESPVLSNPDAMLTIPEDVSISELEGRTEASCQEVADTCFAGFCSPDVCSRFAEDGTKEICGCAE
eukprot:CAMPEP_0172376792 /NCGR_PEP_ID=MMETSP1060-20121228/68568_1 /TAXON_ID=37318 /ORGANISM="Pseudo-nitzschia pungens, Strain cf. cingulata" /LENGTH=1238 /DNA_ID=CAMNT_0013104453 /DNA_START=407 /DNA_END=4123 /DNA_ORIENTATION=+